MSKASRSPEARPPAKPRARRSDAAIVAQYIHDLSAAGARAS
jgi:hypothetical protein